jgi:hypothetical protein
MRFPWSTRWILGALALVALVGGGCGSDGGGGSTVPVPVFIGCTRTPAVFDETFSRVYGAYNGAPVDDTKAPMITMPADGSTVPKGATPPTVTWLLPSPRVAGDDPKGRLDAPRRDQHGCSPYTGDFAWLRVTYGSTKKEVAAIDADRNTTWDVDAATWTEMQAAGRVSIETVFAQLNSNNIMIGPVRSSKAYTFTVQ